MAHELLTTTHGKTPAYHIATARLKLQKEEYDEAEESLNAALQVEHQVSSLSENRDGILSGSG